MSRGFKLSAVLFFLYALLWLRLPLAGQEPFTCEGQVFMLSGLAPGLSVLEINPANNALSFIPLTTSLPEPLDALAFRSADRFLYGIGQGGQQLYRIDAGGAVESLGAPALNPGLQYLAGDISPDGQYLTLVGSAGGLAQALFRIGLEGPGLNVQTVALPGGFDIPDIAYDPFSGSLYGYDATNRRIISINPSTGAVAPLVEDFDAQNDVQGLFFDSFGRLFAYGSTAFGVASALFSIDKATGRELRRQTGPVYPIADMASCPYSAGLENRVSPAAIFPCSEVQFTYTLGNGSGVLTGVVLEHALPPGFSFLEVVRNPFGGIAGPAAPAGVFRLENMSVPRGVDSIIIRAEAGDIAGGSYKSQARLSGLPESLGTIRLSDDPATLAAQDSTFLSVNRIAEDSLFFERFLCLGQSTILDAGEFGNNLRWNDGSSNPQKAVTEQGLYTLEAVSGCQSIFVRYEVTVASCPYTIELAHQILPEETFPCNEVVFRYAIENDSGLERPGATLADTLPEGMSVVEVLRNPFGGALAPATPPGILRLEGLALPPGQDSIDVLVSVGDVGPGIYRNRAVLDNLPPVLGRVRLSDDPRTPQVDSTSLTVFGVDSDTAYVEQTICNGRPIVLDGSPYGTNHLWEDGSTGARLTVNAPGRYQLAVYDGCRPSFVFFEVREGDFIEARFPEEKVKIHLGERHQLEPLIINAGDTLDIEWSGPQGNSLSCLTCPAPIAMPLDHVAYTLRVSNGVCADTARVVILVDKSRRIYAPTAFSPNGDGRNDYFYLQSPDFGILRSLEVYGRWGDLVFRSGSSALNEAQAGWDGRTGSGPAAAGLYLWKAEIEFIGQIREVFSGAVSLLR